jgi:hypothetical protein
MTSACLTADRRVVAAADWPVGRVVALFACARHQRGTSRAIAAATESRGGERSAIRRGATKVPDSRPLTTTSREFTTTRWS